MTEQEQASRRMVVSGLAEGFRFARTKLKVIFLLALLPTALDLLVNFLQYHYPLSLRSLFFSSVVHVFAQSWMLLSLVFCAFFSLKKQPLRPASILLSSLAALPKVFLAYLALLLLVAFSAIVFFPLLLFLVLLIWSPIFVGLENMALVDPAKKDLPEDLELVELADLIEEQARRSTHTFRYKGVFSFAFVRSFLFARANLDLTFQTAIFLWTAQILPFALVVFLLGGELGLASVLGQTALSPLVQSFCALAAIYAFISRLPESVLEEIGLDLSSALSSAPLSSNPIEARPRPWIFFLCLVLSSCSLWYVQHSANQRSQVPQGLEVNLLEAQADGEKFNLRISIYDEKKQLRWFNEERLRLELVSADELRQSFSSGDDGDIAKQDAPFELLSFAVYDETGRLDSQAFAPARKSLRMEFQFLLKEELKKTGRFVLSYKNADGTYKSLLESSYRSIRK